MLARRFFYVSLGILALSMAYHLAASRATAQGTLSRENRDSGVLASQGGRYVFGVVADVKYMLDTETGKLWELHYFSEESARAASTDSLAVASGPVLDHVPYGGPIVGDKRTLQMSGRYLPD
jgi:hypothetical protein